MALLKIENVRISGMSVGVPRKVVKTISTTSKYGAEDFVATTGVIEKRLDNLPTSDLALPAVEKLIADLKWDKLDIKGLVFVTQTPDYFLPATSCVVQGKLGLGKDCYAMDINLGCSGWVYGLSAMAALMQAGCIKKAIVIAGDARKQAAEEQDQLFGFAATATALEYDENAGPIYFDFGTDGTGYDAIIRPGGGCRNQFNENSLKLEMCDDGRMRHSLQTRMKGMDVFAFGISTAPKSIKNLAKFIDGENNDKPWLDYDYYIFHQANMKMNAQIVKKLKLEDDKVPYSMSHFGNTSSASIPLTIVTQLKDKIKNKKTKFMCCGFGVGLSWGTVAFTTEDFIISDLVEV